MIIQMGPQFTEGFILRQEMLVALSDHAFGLGELLFEGYANGILTGCRLSTTDKAIEVGPGIVVFEGRLCLLKESLAIAYHPTDTLCLCKLHFSDEYRTNTSIYREAELIMTETMEPRANELEICRFKLQPNARLRFKYDDFEDRSTEFDTLNTIHAPFAALGKSTLSPEVLHVFAKELMTASSLEPLDQMFCMKVLSMQSTLPQEAIAAYIQMRTGDTPEPCTNGTLYRELLKILKNVKQGTDPKSKKPGRTQWRLTLD